MDRLIASSSVPFASADTAPTTGTPQYATDGNPGTNTPATMFPAYAWNAIQDEIMSVILAAGLTPNRNVWNQLLTAIQMMLQGSTTNVGVDTGAANAYVVAFTPALTAPVPWVPFWIEVKTTNTGASTLNATGTVEPLVGGAHLALQGGEMVAKGNALIYWNPTLASNAGSYVLLFCSGAPEQIAPATQSEHAMQLGQATGRFLRATRFLSSTTFTPLASTTQVIVKIRGGGGGSGSAAATGAGQVSCGGPGSQGAYCETLITSGFSGQAITVGAGGAGGTAGGAGSRGGTSTFMSASATGGYGGGSSGASSASAVAGAQGVATASGGTISNANGGGGAFSFAVAAGGVQFGAGAVGGGDTQPSAVGNIPGSGGGGIVQPFASSGAIAGVAGAAGYVEIWEYA